VRVDISKSYFFKGKQTLIGRKCIPRGSKLVPLGEANFLNLQMGYEHAAAAVALFVLPSGNGKP
jgi:hypothetical protein